MQSSGIAPLPFETLQAPGHGVRTGNWLIFLGVVLMVAGVIAPTLGVYIPADFETTSTAPVDPSFFLMFMIPGVIGFFLGAKFIAWGYACVPCRQ